jgi:hypothetical protein
MAGTLAEMVMIRNLRRQGPWPANSYARFLWLAIGLWEGILALADVYRSSSDDETRLVLAFHVLGDFDSLDELLREFHNHIKREELCRLSATDADKMRSAFLDYHRAVQPQRESLKEIRNCLGSHRTGEPWRKAPRSGVTSPDEWGKWEGYLLELEGRCDLTLWVPVLNSARELLNLLKDFSLDQWFDISEHGNISFYFPVLPPGHHPRDVLADESK